MGSLHMCLTTCTKHWEKKSHLPALHEHCTAYLGLVGRYDVWLRIAVERKKLLTQKAEPDSFAEPLIA